MKLRLILFSALGAVLASEKLSAQAVWIGGGGANTNWSDSPNWSNTPPNNGTDVIVFTNPTAYTSTVNTNWSINTLTVTGTAGALVLDSSGGATLTIGGGGGGFFYGGAAPVAVNVPIAGTGNFWLNGGTGTVTVNPGAGSNTFTGSTEVFGGATLSDGEANSFSAASVLYPGGTGGGTVLVNFNETVAGLNDGGANGLVKIASGMTLTLTGAFSTTYSGVIADNGGPGGLTMNGPSTQTLEGANTYTGPTVINSGGGINIGGGTATGSIVSNVSGAGSIGFDRSNAYTYAGTLSGALDVVQSGTGTTTLSGINTYTGPTTIIAGTLKAGSTSAFGNSANTLHVNGSGTLDLNGFNITIDSIQSAAASTIALNGGAALTLSDPSPSTTIAGVISGNGSLNTSTFSLDVTGNANTYSGGTTISAGTLIANNTNPAASATGTGPITILPGAALLLGQANTNGYISPGSAITDNGALQFFRTDLSANLIANTITGSGGVAQNGTGITELSGANTYSGTTDVFQGTLEAGSTSAFGGAAGKSQISFSFDGTLSLNGFNNTVGSISGTTTTGGVSLGANTLTIADATSNTNFAPVISGVGGSLVFGGQSMIVTGANTYTGGTTINNGNFLVANTTGSGTGTGPITIASGAQLEIGADGTAGSVAAATIADGGTILLSRSDSPTLAANISGTGSVHMVGSGAFTLSGTNSYSGVTNVSSGELIAGSTTAFGGASLSSVDINTGGILSLSTFNNTVGSIAGDTTGQIQLGSATLTIAGGQTTTYSGIISGTGALVQNGPGGTTLDGANTYTGGTTITDGTLSIGDSLTPGASIVGNVLDSTSLTFLPASADNITFPGAITGGGTVAFSGVGTIKFSNSGANLYSGSTSVNSGTLADSAPNAFSPNSSVNISSAGALAVNFNETIKDLENGSGGGPVTIASGSTLTIGTGNSALAPFVGTISGPGALAISTNLGLNLSQGLAGANSYSGGTTVLSGELFVGSNTALGTGTATFLAGTELSPSASVTLANPIVLSGGEALDNDDGGSFGLTLTGLISEVAGSGSITWCTPGTLSLTNANTFTGGVDMREGVLLLGTDTAAGTGTITLDSNTVLSAYGNGITRTIANNLNITGSPAQIGNFDNNFITVTGLISGEASLQYAGGTNGTLTLTGSNTGFTGPFTIMSGTVYAGNDNAFGSPGNTVNLTGGVGLNVMSGITINNPLFPTNAANVLSGSGTIGAPVTVDGTIVLSPSASPGGGPGNLSFSSTLTLTTGGAIHFDIYDAAGGPGTGYSLITAGGGLDLTAAPNTLTFNLVSVDASGNPAPAINFNPAAPYTWTFANSTSAISGFSPTQFNLDTSGFANATGGGTFSFSESGNSLDLNFTPVPEPSTWAMMGTGLLAAVPFALRRRRAYRT